MPRVHLPQRLRGLGRSERFGGLGRAALHLAVLWAFALVQPLLDLLDRPELSGSALRSAFADARLDGSGTPSIEAILHAICLAEFGAAVAVHTHPVAANALLCSSRSRSASFSDVGDDVRRL